MAKKKKKMPGLNTSSTADISFMLLIFFLVTTSMDTDMGLARRLPQPPDNDQEKPEMKIHERDIMCVRLNAAGFLWVSDGNGSGYAELTDLRQRAKDFISNEHNSPNLPEKMTKNIDLLGQCSVTENHVISVQTDRGTPYEVYFAVQNELVGAYNELRNDLSKEKFHKEYRALTEDQAKAIREYYPQKISEAEPKNYGGGN